MRRYLRLYPYLVLQHLKIMLEYRADFLIGIFSSVLANAAFLVTLGLIMARVPLLNGWSFPELLLIYGLMLMARALMDTFAGNFWSIGGYVRRGRFDDYLVRPINPLFYFLAAGFNTEGLGTFLTGLAIAVPACQALGLWSPLNAAYLALTVLTGGLIYFSINLITASTAFWIVDSMPVTAAVFGNNEFAHYPLTIFPRPIRLLVTWLIPYGFAGFYPASYLLGRDLGQLAWVGPVMAVLLLALGYRFWNFGLSRYTSTGS